VAAETRGAAARAAAAITVARKVRAPAQRSSVM
jgi:hypothetical protein